MTAGPQLRNESAHSGCSLRGTHVRVRTAGLRNPQAAARTAFSRPKFKIRGAACEGPAQADLRTRGAGLRGAKLRPVAPCGHKFRIQNSRFKIADRTAACGGHARSEPAGRELRASAAPRLRPADLLRGRYLHKVSPQPSGRACNVEEQPSARERLRAANRYAIEFAGNHLNQTRRAAARRCPTASPRPCKKYGPGNDPTGQKPAESAAGFFSGIVFDLFPDSCGSATAVRFLHLFKFGLVVLEGAIPSGAAGSREDSLLFFLRTGPTAATLPLHHPPEPATRPDAAAKNNPAKTAAKNSPRK